MKHELLIELGLEEVPARFIPDAVKQWRDKTAKWLKDARIECAGMQMFATPRRMALYITGLSDKQADISEEVKGPARKIAVDEQGEWTKAALGFARSQGVDPEHLILKELKGVEYVYANKNQAGLDSLELLEKELPTIIQSLVFPKNMRWGTKSMRFVRPIRWIVALFDEQVLPLQLAGVDADRQSLGHRFLGAPTEIAHPRDYEARLKEQYVIADPKEREQMIRRQIARLAENQGWHIPMKQDLLQEIVYLVEYPTVLCGSFHPDYLDIPQEVLITSMREHQRYFPVLDQAGKLLPHFVTVRNGDERSLDTVARGNEKVLKARLADARFFYMEDQKLTIDKALAKLETVVFHEELGSTGDKIRRIRSLAEKLSGLLQVSGQETLLVDRAASICKFDLVSQMVYEFPELQGVMGEDYALKSGETPEVAKAINEHYAPRFSGDRSPSSLIGSIVSIADKLDTIAGCFSIGIIPTGSQDPYALRRQAAGIVQICLDHDLSCTLSDLFDCALSILQQNNLAKRSAEDIQNDMKDFFALRVKHLLSERYRYDIVEAVLAVGADHVPSAIRRAEALKQMAADPNSKAVLEAFNRVSNLAEKAAAGEAPDASMMTEPAEQKLHQMWSEAHRQFVTYMQHQRESEALLVLQELEPSITGFFNDVMVMAKDDRIKENRLALLRSIAADCRTFADFQKIVG